MGREISSELASALLLIHYDYTAKLEVTMISSLSNTIGQKSLMTALISLLVAASTMLFGCSNEESIAPAAKTLSATKQSPSDVGSSGKPGKVNETTEELEKASQVAKPSIESGATGTTTASTTGSGTSTVTPATVTPTVAVVSTSLTYESGQVTRTREDGSMAVQIDLIGDAGAIKRSITIQNQDEGDSSQLADMCHKGATTKWKVSFIAGKTKKKGDKCYFVVSNNQSKVQLDVDIQGDDDGCKPGEDDKFEFSCPSGSIELL